MVILILHGEENVEFGTRAVKVNQASTCLLIEHDLFFHFTLHIPPIYAEARTFLLLHHNYALAFALLAIYCSLSEVCCRGDLGEGIPDPSHFSSLSATNI